jgi:tetratricopeptide (TPR) repeat protein
MITFGLAWSAVAFLPVHNVLLPTGIVLAERTLFLPSIGAFFALGGLLAFVLERIRRPLRVAVAGLTATLLALGIYRSNLRHQVWSDQFKLWYVTANQDAPRSFRAHEAMADSYWYIDLEGQAEREYRLAMQLAPPPFTGPMLNYAHRLRSRGNCYPAVDLYRKALRVRPGNMPSLVPLIACLLDLGRYREAAGQARIAIAHAWRQPVFQQILATADSSLRVQAPPGTVRVTVAEKDELYRYLTIGKAR